MDFTPDIVQVVPHMDYTVSVYFVDGKIVLYNVKPKLDKGVFTALRNQDVFMNQCKIMNNTLAWDLSGNNDPTNCIDIDPDTLYSLEHVGEVQEAGQCRLGILQ